MARFRYSLQNILNIKEKMETQAKQEFGTAQAALNVETEHLERLKERRREYEEQSAGLLKGKLDLRAIEENKEALLKMDSLVAAQCIRVDKAKENVEAARERMAEAMKERKMHETPSCMQKNEKVWAQHRIVHPSSRILSENPAVFHK